MGSTLKDLLANINPNFKIKYTPFFDKNMCINGGKFRVIDNTNNLLVTYFVLSQMRGCNGVCISSNVVVEEEYRGNGLGTKFNYFREVLAKKMNYSLMLCTVVDGNEKQEKIMNKQGWTICTKFLNLKTKNTVKLFFKPI